ncbi:MAG: bifunctional metallophosphatase/5'-nucleotidase [Bdellovibrionales bacterium]|nr:bifunctional metallophosphatase/5'-nucleotidase [Bdellovibrionales bacterium]
MKTTSIRSRSRHAIAPLLLFLAGCASLTSQNDEVVPFENSGNLETVVVLGTNDIHGALAPAELKTKDPTPIEYEKGGAAIFASHVRILRQQYGDHLLLLDAGDEFQGSIDSNLEEGRPMVRFFNQLGYNAAAIGNHEFDFGPEGSLGSYDPATSKGLDLRGTLKARIREANYPYLAANIYTKKGEFPGIPGTKASTIVRAGKLRVGIIGLTTLDTPTTTRPAFAADLEFRDMAKTAIAESKKLREDGADIVVVVTHSGVFCNIPMAADRTPRPGLVRSETDFQTGCESNHEVPELLRRVPKGTIDAVVSGHTHSLVHHWIEGVPVIQAGTQDVYYNLIYLTYDWSAKKLRTEKTRIEGPIPICPKVFANQRNCNGDQAAPEKGRGDLVAAKLRGVTIGPDSAMESVLAPTFAHTEAKKREVVGKAAQPVPHIKERESPLGDFVADSIRESLGTQIAIMNPGGIRADWESGEIHYADVFKTLPFDNYLSKLTLTGKELRRLVRITNAGARGFFSTSGLVVRAIRREDEPYSSDLDGNGKIEPWELDRLIDVTLADGTPIEDGKTYTVGTLDFLVSGGDSLGWFMNQLPKDRVVMVAGPVLRDAVIAHLGKVTAAQPEGINSDAHPIVDPNRPRLILERRVEKKRQKSSGHRRRRKRH